MKRCYRQRSARTIETLDMSNNVKLRVSPFGLIATTPGTDAAAGVGAGAKTKAAPDIARRHRARRFVPCSRERRRIRTATLPPTSWLAICIAVEESELEEGWDSVSIH